MRAYYYESFFQVEQPRADASHSIHRIQKKNVNHHQFNFGIELKFSRKITIAFIDVCGI